MGYYNINPMKKLLFLIALFYGLKVNAQNYLITFTGTGESTTVSNVKVENLMKGTTLALNGGDVLRLTLVTGVNPIYENQTSEIKTYPNPVIDNATVEIFPPVAGNAVVTVFDMNGRLVGLLHGYLENSRQDFRLTGLKTGFHLVSVRGNNYQFSGSILSYGKSGGTVRLEKISNVVYPVYEKAAKTETKGSQAIVDMAYSIGDRLKFTGISGIYSTVKTDIPTSDKTITFNFIVCTDGDNNNYPVVEIGNQVWMGENLKTTRFNEGTAISYFDNEWSTVVPKYCWYKDDPATYKDVYGALYNWYTVNDLYARGKNVCPTGWHVPDQGEWMTLIQNSSGGKLKETGYTHWQSPNSDASNETGFTALPGGSRYHGVQYVYCGLNGYWWSSSENSPLNGMAKYMSSVNGNVSGSYFQPFYGMSVRCLHGQIVLPTVTTMAVNTVTPTSAISGVKISISGYGDVSRYGICWSTTPNPTLHDNTRDGVEYPPGTNRITVLTMNDLTPNTIYYVRAYSNRNYSPLYPGTIYGDELVFKTFTGTVTDVDGNRYNTVTIGNQLWMAENLKTTRYDDNTTIALVTDDAEWAELSGPGYCWYNNDEATYKKSYGALYNWYVLNNANNGDKNVCPYGWVAPTDEQLTSLTDYLEDNGYGFQGTETDIAKSVAATLGWTVNPSPGTPGNYPEGNNISGFTALPGGFRSNDGSFGNIDNDGYWWTTSDSWYRNMSSDYSKVYRGQWGKTHGFSIRCIHGPIFYPTIIASVVSSVTQTSVTIGGNVTSDGGSPVTARGVCWSISPNPTIENSKTIDGAGTGNFTSSITGLNANTTYFIRVYATNSLGTDYSNEQIFKTYTGTVTDIDDNIYNTVTIGLQLWMAENLKTTRFSDGTAIPLVTDKTAWDNLTTPGFCWYNNDEATYKATYGALYNWYNINTGNLCPAGWHVPTDAEWTILTNYLGGESVAGGKLKEAGTAHWESPNIGATNETSFTALPGGFREYFGMFETVGGFFRCWSSSESSTRDAWSRVVDRGNSDVYIDRDDKRTGSSVRCIQDN
jgi:uncharacterized protein (TIGR02145 family)